MSTENVSYVEKVFRNKAEEEKCNILVSQWEYDKKLIPDALKAVVVMFPHFSLHDESHSETILDNIVNILGKRGVDSLSCTDLWLLLESAYCHDLGMVITANRIKEAFKDGSFIHFYQSVKSDIHHELNKFTRLFDENNGKLMIKRQELSLSTFDAVKFLFADYFRRQHGINAVNAITNPLGQLGVESPRAVIPTRLYELLGHICLLHTKNFSEVMKLPYIENGVSLDKAHPRFIACMLRIGDLLDLDNHRFNETLIRTLDEIPENSSFHREKHHSINHFRVDNQYIEVSALCKNPRVARITRQWFDWIKEEFNNQTQKWNDIVPSGINCYLPTVNQLTIDIEGYLGVDKDDEPKFTIDVDKALELLQGKNFYKSPFDSIREILQNAVDSTLIRFFLDSEDEGNIPLAPDGEFLKRAKDYLINVYIKRTADNKLRVSVHDNGMGLKRSHLRFLSNTGSSSRNVEKRIIVERMPDWLRPSGIFGIGFQSIFLLTEEIRIQTKDYLTDECYEIELHKPNSRMNGDIYLRPLAHRKNPGLIIEFDLDDIWSNKPISQDNFSGLYTDEVENILSKSIIQFAEMSIIPIYLNGKEITRHEMHYFDKENGIELFFGNLDLKPGFRHSTYYFKNARVESGGPNIPFVHPIINVLSGTAKDYLSLDRNSFDNDKIKVINKKVEKAILNYMKTTEYDSLVNGNEIAKLLFSLFIKWYGLEMDSEKVVPTNMLNFTLMGEELNTVEILGYKEVTLGTISDRIIKVESNREASTCHIESNMIMIPQLAIMDEYFSLLFKLLGEKHKHCICKRLRTSGFLAGGDYSFTDDDNIDTEITIEKINSLLNITEDREYILYIKGYDAIRIPSDRGIEDTIRFNVGPGRGINKKMEKILSPFIKIKDENYDCRTDKLYEYVCKLNGKSIEEVRSCYERFVEDCKSNGINFNRYVF